MRYASIRELDISNGKGVGVALFVQGCQFHCYNCFNMETWDFDMGKEWTEDTKKVFFELIDRPYIKRVSILGGEPFASQNVSDVLNLLVEIRSKFPDKEIWLYTGYTWENIFFPIVASNFDIERDRIIDIRKTATACCNVLVDGKYIDSQRDLALKWRGSNNQRIIDVKKSLKNNEIVLYTE